MVVWKGLILHRFRWNTWVMLHMGDGEHGWWGMLISLVSTRRLSVMHSLRMCCKILCQNLVVHPKCMLGGSTKFHPFLCWGWVGGLTEFDAEFKLAKIQNSYVEGGWVDGWLGGLMEVDAEFKFAKIQNSYFHEPPPTPHPQHGNFGFLANLKSASNSMNPPPTKIEISVQDWT